MSENPGALAGSPACYGFVLCVMRPFLHRSPAASEQWRRHRSRWCTGERRLAKVRTARRCVARTACGKVRCHLTRFLRVH